MKKLLSSILLTAFMIMTVFTTNVSAKTFATSGDIFNTAEGWLYWTNENGRAIAEFVGPDIDQQPVESADGFTYTFTWSSVNFTLLTDGEKLLSLEANGFSADIYDGTYKAPSANKTIADILATVEGGFPTEVTNGWTNGTYSLYANNNKLYHSNGDEINTSTTVTSDGNNYKVVETVIPNLTYTFIMTNNKLEKITIEGDDGFSGTYIAPAPVAQIGDTGYLTLQDAINAVQDNDTITIFKDFTVSSAIESPENKTFTIDLNNFTMSTTKDDAFTIDATNLTVKNGTINHSVVSGSAWEPFFLKGENEGSLTLNGVDITSPMYSAYISSSSKNKNLTINDCHFISTGDGVIYAGGVDTSNVINITNSVLENSNTGTAVIQLAAKTTLENVKITSASATALVCYENTDLLVKGTENSFIGASGAISTNGSKDLVQITIEGGEFKTTGTSKEAGIAFYHPDGSPLTIKGGTFEGATALYVKGGTIDIQGGSFTGTGNYEAAQKVSSGAYATGDAVVIEASGYLAGEDYNPDPNPSVSISGGLFKSTNGSPIAYYTFDGNKEAHEGKMVSGGVLNKTIADSIIVEGKTQVANTDKNTSAEYPYMIGNNTAEIEVETDNKENVVPTYQDETKQAVANKLSETNVDLGPEALTIAADGNIVNESLEAKVKEVTGFETGDDLTITIKTYLDMSVEKVNITDTVGSVDNTFSIDITPKYVIVAQVNDGEEKVVSEGKDLSVTRTVLLRIYLPDGFANSADRVWVKHHLKDGSSVVYGGNNGLVIQTDTNGKYVEFENPDGFSVFDVYLKKVNPDPKPTPTPKPRYIVPNTGVEDIPTNNNSLLKKSSLSLLAIGTYLVIKKKKDND